LESITVDIKLLQFSLKHQSQSLQTSHINSFTTHKTYTRTYLFLEDSYKASYYQRIISNPIHKTYITRKILEKGEGKFTHSKLSVYSGS